MDNNEIRVFYYALTARNSLDSIVNYVQGGADYVYLYESNGKQYIVYYKSTNMDSFIHFIGISSEYHISLRSIGLNDTEDWLSLFEDLEDFGLIDMHYKSKASGNKNFKDVMRKTKSEVIM